MEILNKLHHKKPPTDHLPTFFRPPTDHLPTIYRPSTDHLPTTYRPPTNHLPTTYRPLFFTVQLVQYFLQLFLGVNSCVHDVLHLSGQTGAEIVTALSFQSNGDTLKQKASSPNFSPVFKIILQPVQESETTDKLTKGMILIYHLYKCRSMQMKRTVVFLPLKTLGSNCFCEIRELRIF